MRPECDLRLYFECAVPLALKAKVSAAEGRPRAEMDDVFVYHLTVSPLIGYFPLGFVLIRSFIGSVCEVMAAELCVMEILAVMENDMWMNS